MMAILLSVRLLAAGELEIQEYRVGLMDLNSGRVVNVVTTDKRFFEHRRGSCVVARPLHDGRVYYGGDCNAR
jgi:hypothetical protein